MKLLSSYSRLPQPHEIQREHFAFYETSEEKQWCLSTSLRSHDLTIIVGKQLKFFE